MKTEPGSTPFLDKEAGGRIAKGKRDRGGMDALKKWFGMGAALISGASAIYGTLQYQAETQARARTIAELLTTSKTELDANDYAGAWKSTQEAAETIDKDGVLVKLFNGLSAQQKQVRAAQQDLAMEWLRASINTPLKEGETYASFVDPMLPVLSNGAQDATGPRKADLLAHIGLAYDFKSNDEVHGLHPERFYKEAIAVEPNNPYANTLLGFVTVGESSASAEGIAQAQKYFAAALASSRARGLLREWVHKEQFQSIRRWSGYPAVPPMWWQAVNEMYKAREPLDNGVLIDMYDQYIGNTIAVERFQKNLDTVLAFAPIDEHIALLHLLLQSANAHGDKRLYLSASLALALEKAGKIDAALATWRDAKSMVDSQSMAASYLGKQVDQAIERLTATHK